MFYLQIGDKTLWTVMQSEKPTVEGWRNLALIIAAIVGFPFLVWRSIIAQNQVSVAKAGQDFDRYQKGAEMLGHTRLSVRQAGIFALKELALRNSEAYLNLVQQVLCSFIRDRSEEDREAAKAQGAKTAPEDDEVETPDSPIASDNQTAITTLVRDFASLRKNRGTARLNLTKANLNGADFIWANLSDVDLGDANLSDANLRGANLFLANLSDANLSHADLEHASLSHANLIGANLSNAYLSDANLSQADLRHAKNLTQEQLDEAWAWADRPPSLDKGLQFKTEMLFDPTLRADYEKSGRRGPPLIPDPKS